MPRKAKSPIHALLTPPVPQPPTPPPAPEPPNPVVLALQEQILGLVNQRGVEQEYLVKANAALRGAQASAESARERLQMVESEVRYRLGLIAELQGKPAPINIEGLRPVSSYGYTPTPEHGSPDQFDQRFLVATPGVGSIPQRRAPMAGVEGEVRSEGADDIRRSL